MNAQTIEVARKTVISGKGRDAIGREVSLFFIVPGFLSRSQVFQEIGASDITKPLRYEHISYNGLGIGFKSETHSLQQEEF